MEEESETLYWCPAHTRADRWHAVQLLLLHWRVGLGELIVKVYHIESSSLCKNWGTRHPTGHEEEIGTNHFCLVELDPLMRFSNPILFIRRCFHLISCITPYHSPFFFFFNLHTWLLIIMNN